MMQNDISFGMGCIEIIIVVTDTESPCPLISRRGAGIAGLSTGKREGLLVDGGGVSGQRIESIADLVINDGRMCGGSTWLSI